MLMKLRGYETWRPTFKVCMEHRVGVPTRMLVVSREESCRSLIVVMVIVLIVCAVTGVACVHVMTTTGPAIGVTCRHGNVINSSISHDDKMPDEQRLLVKLLRSYDPGIRPVFNVTQNVVVNFSLTLVQIMDMVRN